MEDVDGSRVAVLQRGSHRHVVVGILIEVAHRDDGGPEAGVLEVVGILQRPVVNKPALEKQGQGKAQGALARALGAVTPSGLQRPLSPLSPASLLGLAQQWAWAFLGPSFPRGNQGEGRDQVPLGGRPSPQISTCLRV